MRYCADTAGTIASDRDHTRTLPKIARTQGPIALFQRREAEVHRYAPFSNRELRHFLCMWCENPWYTCTTKNARSIGTSVCYGLW